MCHDDHTVLPVRQTDHVLVDTITLRGDQIYYTQISEQRIEQTIGGDCTGQVYVSLLIVFVLVSFSYVYL